MTVVAPCQKQGVLETGSPGRTRTADKEINSLLLYQLSYRGRRARMVLMRPPMVKGGVKGKARGYVSSRDKRSGRVHSA